MENEGDFFFYSIGLSFETVVSLTELEISPERAVSAPWPVTYVNSVVSFLLAFVPWSSFYIT